MNYITIKRNLSKYKKLYSVLSWCRLHMVGLYYRTFLLLFKLFPIENNKIVVVNYSGKGYGDNAKYIVNELQKSKLNVKIYWAVSNKNDDSLPIGIKKCKYNSISFLYHLATAKVWINNSRFPYGINKRKKQFYIQTWHSSLRLKKIEKDAEEILSKPLIYTCKKDSKMIDLIISGCEFSTNIYRNSFWYDGEIQNTGTPRCDLFFNIENYNKLKKNISIQYNFDENKKIILYAPTFRKNMDERNCYMDVKKFSKLLRDDYILLVRFHPISKYNIMCDGNVINVTNYSDMQELICISDFLITDYSGCCFDMMINSKPCILLTKDLEDYLKKERSLYFRFDELPFTCVKNEKDLINLIHNFDYTKYNDNICKFKQKIGLCEYGNASKKVVDKIAEKIKI